MQKLLPQPQLMLLLKLLTLQRTLWTPQETLLMLLARRLTALLKLLRKK